MFSIDQNCHSLWDVIPKLHALTARGVRVRHLIEDIDVAFTALGSAVDVADLRLQRERFYRGGGQDWGAAVFYSQFLGRLAADLRDWEDILGMKAGTVARRLGQPLEKLYDEFSPSDNWQLIGSSYVGDRRHHRVIGDLSVREVEDILHEIMDIAWADCMQAFPQSDSQQRLREWFSTEHARMERLVAETSAGRLVDLYDRWLRQYLSGPLERGTLQIGLTSSVFSCRRSLPGVELLNLFTSDYQRAAAVYNQALESSMSPLRPLNVGAGELPMFATFEHRGQVVRAGAFLDGRQVRIGDMAFDLDGGAVPLESMCRSGIRALAGKAVLLVIQARMGDGGCGLALPYRGSLYMPAAEALVKALRTTGLLMHPVKPVLRVRFRLLERMRGLDTVIRLPEHLAPYFGQSEIPARKLAEEYSGVAAMAARRLEQFADRQFRRRWQRENCPALAERVDELDRRRRQLAQTNPKDPQLRRIWKEMKPLLSQLLEHTVRQIARDWQARDLDYWDSRGALIPWCVGLGGEVFYNEVIAKAEIYEETH